MKVPSKEAFEKWKEFANRLPGELALLKFEEQLSTKSTTFLVASRALAEAVHEDMEAMWNEVDHLEVGAWLSQDLGFRRAGEKQFNRQDDPPLEKRERIERTVYRLLGYEEHQDRVHNLMLRTKRLIENRTIGRTWIGQIAAAVNEYLHIDHDAQHAARSKAANTLQKILSLLDEVKPIVESEVGERQFERIGWQIERSLQRTTQSHPERDQKNKAEHLFVRRAARISQSFSKNGKIRPVVVDHLQCIGAIRQQFDIRTIHRICKELTEEDKKRAELFRAEMAEFEASRAMKNNVDELLNSTSYK